MCLGRGEVRDRPLWQAWQVIRHLDDGRELIGSGRVSVHSPHFVGNRYIFPHRLCFCLVIKATSGCLAVCKGRGGGEVQGRKLGERKSELTETRRERGRKGGRKEEGREVQARKLGGKGQRHDGGKEEGEEREKKEEKK